MSVEVFVTYLKSILREQERLVICSFGTDEARVQGKIELLNKLISELDNEGK